MGFVDYGWYAEFLHIRDAFSWFCAAVFIGAQKKGGETAEIHRETAISHWLAVFGAPEILVVGKDMGVYWWNISGFSLTK